MRVVWLRSVLGALAGVLVGSMTACSAAAPAAKHGAGSGGLGGGAGFGGNGASGFGGGGSVVLPAAGSGVGSAGSSAGTCVGLQCQQRACAGGTSTTISGTVYDPAGKNPLYNVVVYVPNEAVQPLSAGASCDTCEALYTGKPIATALTDAAGKFKLEKAPDGANIPLVIQVGKWRKQLKLATVAPCQDNPQPDKSLTLPKNHNEGDIPNIAISTGGADTLECLLARVGVDRAEYVPGADPKGRIHIFGGEGAAGGFMIPGFGNISLVPNTSPPGPGSSAALWDKLDDLKPYDILLLSCEGSETANMNQQVLHDYASAGGRVFASHYHYSWFNSGPYANENLATWSPGGNSIGDINGTIVTTLPNGMPFPKGLALQQWLGNVGALNGGVLPIQQARHNADVGPANTPSQAWIVADQTASAPGATQYFSFNTPVNPPMTPDGRLGYCGRVVFSDLHVGAASGDAPGTPIPTGCADADLSAQEKALEFMLFDLSSCVVPDTKPPAAPPIVVQ